MTLQPPDLNGTKEIIDIRQYFSVLRHWAWLIATITLVAGLAAYIISKQLTPIYRATTTILINEAPSSKVSDYNSILTSERLTRTYAQMLTTQPLLNEVAQKLKLQMSLDSLRDAISVEPVRDTQLILISVESGDPNQASNIANTLIVVFADKISSMQAERFAVSKQNLQNQLLDMEKQIQATNQALSKATDESEKNRLESKLAQQQELYSTLLLSYEQVRLSEAETSSNVVQVEPALPPSKPIRPSVFANTMVVSAVALFLAIGTIFAFEALDDTLKSPEDVTRQLHLPVLSVISHYTTEDGKPITEAEPRSPVSEAFRTLRTNVQYAGVDNPLRTILITSPAPGEGKTSVATNLGIVLAQSGSMVTILDCDMRRPSVHRKLSLRNHVGLSSLFVRPNILLNGIIQKTRTNNLSVITSGRRPPNPSELLGSQKMQSILEKVREEKDIILIDTPPTLAVTDAAVLVPFVDGVLLVMRPGVTKLAAARQAVEQLQRMGGNLIGVVLNDVELTRSRYGYYYYYRGYQGVGSYYYYSDEEKKEKTIPRNKPKSQS